MNMAPFSYYMLLPRGKCSQLDPENDQFSLWKLVFQPRQLAGSMLILLEGNYGTSFIKQY